MQEKYNWCVLCMVRARIRGRARAGCSRKYSWLVRLGGGFIIVGSFGLAGVTGSVRLDGLTSSCH